MARPPLPFKVATQAPSRPAKPSQDTPRPLVPGPVYLPPWETGIPAPVSTGEVLPENVDPEIDAYDFRYVHPRKAALRQVFVAEFAKDWNVSAAILRMGLNYAQPAATGAKWLGEPYTQYLLDKYIREAGDEALITRGQIIVGLIREANSHGLDSSGASRVSALGKLSKILGMEIDRTETDIRVSGGLLLVPVAANADDWERNAAESQRQLKLVANV